MNDATYAKIGSDAVCKSTGKTWQEWFAVLDAAGARRLTHKEIVAVLRDQHEVGPWWQQMLTVGYEQARGLRVKHERPDGYQISRSKTIAVPLADLFQACKDKRKRGQWLAGAAVVIRKATENKSLRMTWSDGETHVEMMFYAKGAAKSQVTIDHSRLKDAMAAEKMKAFWGERLEQLKELLEK